MKEIEALREEAQKNPNAEAAATALLQGLGKQLAELVNDRRCAEKLSELATHVTANAEPLAAAIVANAKGGGERHRG